MCDLRDAPVITCFSSSAFVGDRNAFLRCDIKARPWVTALYWILDLNGTTIGKAESVSEYWTKVMVDFLVCHVCRVRTYQHCYIVTQFKAKTCDVRP